MKKILLAGILLLQLHSIGLLSRFKVSAMPHQSLNVQGITVHRSFYSTQEPVITHGVIELQNSEQNSHQVAIRKVTFKSGDDTIPINDFFLYQLPDYQEVDPNNLEQPPLTTNQYEISFQAISAVPYLNREMQVEVELDLNGKTVVLASPYIISIRTKRR